MVLMGGVLGGFGRNLTMLVVSRILIGVRTSSAYPSAMLLIRRRAESSGMLKPPGNVLGALQIAGVVTAAVGLPIGGVLVDAWGWRTLIGIGMLRKCWVKGIRKEKPILGQRQESGCNGI